MRGEGSKELEVKKRTLLLSADRGNGTVMYAADNSLALRSTRQNCAKVSNLRESEESTLPIQDM